MWSMLRTTPRRRPRRPARPVATGDRILDAAEALVQGRGFNGMSYADVSQAVGLTTASLHYHFPSKADLGRALVERYTVAFGRALAAIDRHGGSVRRRLQNYARLYADVLTKDRICLCGMLAAEISTLPRSMQSAVRRFFDVNERWLAALLKQARAAGEATFQGSPRDAARAATSMLEGATLLARSYGDPSRLASAARALIDGLAPVRRRRPIRR